MKQCIFDNGQNDTEMGWDTQIIVLVENIQKEERQILAALHEKDAKAYVHNGISFARLKELNDHSKVLFFTYERRKYLPYWTILEISEIYRDLYFTVAASCPDFIGGPAGIIKVSKGDIIDSYGFWGERQQMLESPDPELIYNWFAKDKQEEQLRELYVESHPKRWIEELYHQNVLDFTSEQEAILSEYMQQDKMRSGDWKEMPVL